MEFEKDILWWKNIIIERKLIDCMEKIGVLTFHKSINYGSVLQAWALCTALKEYNISIIDYEPDVYKQNYDLFSQTKGLKYNVNRLLNCVAIKRQIQGFAEFRSKYLPLTQKCTSSDISEKTFSEFDAVITGSDQIWNVHAEDADDAYFLPYNIGAKKIAYACSINNTDFTEKRCDEKLKKWISDYDFISIREKSGADKVSHFLNGEKTIYTVLDPTLLNTKDTFDTITNGRIIKKHYIFLYNVWSGLEAVKAARKISEITGLPVYTAMMDSRIKQILCAEKQGIRVETKYTSPQDFLSLIKYSELVVTDSFHGTAFSLIFEKNFVCINPRNQFGHLKNDERIVSILDIVSLKERYIGMDDIDNFDFHKGIDYTVVTQKRMKEAERCKSLLVGAIEGKIKS